MNIELHLDEHQLAALAEQVAALLEPDDRDEWLSIDEAAEYLRCSKQRIYDLRSSGRLPKTGDGARVLVRRSHLDDFVGGV